MSVSWNICYAAAITNFSVTRDSIKSADPSRLRLDSPSEVDFTVICGRGASRDAIRNAGKTM